MSVRQLSPISLRTPPPQSLYRRVLCRRAQSSAMPLLLLGSTTATGTGCHSPTPHSVDSAVDLLVDASVLIAGPSFHQAPELNIKGTSPKARKRVLGHTWKRELRRSLVSFRFFATLTSATHNVTNANIHANQIEALAILQSRAATGPLFLQRRIPLDSRLSTNRFRLELQRRKAAAAAFDFAASAASASCRMDALVRAPPLGLAIGLTVSSLFSFSGLTFFSAFGFSSGCCLSFWSEDFRFPVDLPPASASFGCLSEGGDLS